MTYSGVLSAQQIADFRRDGFVVVPGLFSTAEMRGITRWTDEMQSAPETPGKYMMYFEKSMRDGSRILNRLENFAPYHAAFGGLFHGDKMEGACSQLLGEPVVLFKDKINFKMPGGDGFKAHQDQQAGWSRYADFFITALVSIDEANDTNGCLELVAGHHARGLVGQEWAPLNDREIAQMKFVSCPTQPGDVVFFDSYAPHRSAPNHTDKPRRVLYVTYNRLSDGDHRAQYYADKRKSYPPDIERVAGKEYVFRV
ncbi:MAG: phytanoyl-CoA dioxygenase family protein [Alphaproteobacteria bacterium]